MLKIIINVALIIINILLNIKYNLKFTCLNSLNLLLYFIFLFLISFIFVLCIERKSKKIFRECIITFSIFSNILFLIFLIYVYYIDIYTYQFYSFPILIEKILSNTQIIANIINKFEITHSTKFRPEEKEMFQSLLLNKTYKEGLLLLDEYFFLKKITQIKTELKNISLLSTLDDKLSWSYIFSYVLEISGEKMIGRPFSLRDLSLMGIGLVGVLSLLKFVLKAPPSDLEIAYQRDPRDFDRVVREDFIPRLKRPYIEQNAIFSQIRSLVHTPKNEKWSEELTEILTPPITRKTDNLINLYDLNLRIDHSLFAMEAERLFGNVFTKIHKEDDYLTGFNFKEEFHLFHLVALQFYTRLSEEFLVVGRKEVITIEDIGKLNVLNQVFLVLLELNAILYDLMRKQEIDLHNFEVYARIFFFRENKIVYEGQLFEDLRNEIKQAYDEIKMRSSHLEPLSDYEWANSLENLIAKYMRVRPRYSFLLAEKQKEMELHTSKDELIDKLYMFFE